MAHVSRDAIDAAADAERILISGEPDSLVRGGTRVKEAADLGSPQAMTRLAHFTAAGVLDKADWDGAVDLLQRAAELGWAPAKDELRVLARGAGATPSEMRSRRHPCVDRAEGNETGERGAAHQDHRLLYVPR